MTKTIFVAVLFVALQATRAVLPCADQDFLVCNPPTAQPSMGNQVAVKPEHDLVEFREVTKHARRVSCCHTSRRDVFGNDAARTDDGVAADADAGKDDRF